MFKNLFKSPVDSLINDIKDSTETIYPQVKVPTMSTGNNACYMVGTTSDGNQTQLKIGQDYSMTLTLSPDSVALLIKQLAVTIDHRYDITVQRLPDNE